MRMRLDSSPASSICVVIFASASPCPLTSAARALMTARSASSSCSRKRILPLYVPVIGPTLTFMLPV